MDVIILIFIIFLIKGDWLWPAMWLLPNDWVYGGWPTSGEIDICETRGNTDLKCGNDLIVSLD